MAADDLNGDALVQVQVQVQPNRKLTFMNANFEPNDGGTFTLPSNSQLHNRNSSSSIGTSTKNPLSKSQYAELFGGWGSEKWEVLVPLLEVTDGLLGEEAMLRIAFTLVPDEGFSDESADTLFAR